MRRAPRARAANKASRRGAAPERTRRFDGTQREHGNIVASAVEKDGLLDELGRMGCVVAIGSGERFAQTPFARFDVARRFQQTVRVKHQKSGARQRDRFRATHACLPQSER